MKSPVILAALLIAAAVGVLGFVFSGLADVAATSPHWAVTRWFLAAAMERSVKRHARGIEPPADLDQDARVRSGARAYDAMCVGCHGAPGVEPDVVGKGLNPEPPDLARVASKWKPSELFWITSNGVRMTGMPAFGPTHSDEELWELVAFVARLPRLSSADYAVLRSEEEPDAHRHHHHHRHEGPE